MRSGTLSLLEQKAVTTRHARQEPHTEGQISRDGELREPIPPLHSTPLSMLVHVPEEA